MISNVQDRIAQGGGEVRGGTKRGDVEGQKIEREE